MNVCLRLRKEKGMHALACLMPDYIYANMLTCPCRSL